MVGTGLHHEYAVAGLEVPNGGGPGGEERQISLEAGHQDREGRQRDGLRRLQRHAAHHLRIADHQSRRFLQAGEGRPEFSFRHHKA